MPNRITNNVLPLTHSPVHRLFSPTPRKTYPDYLHTCNSTTLSHVLQNTHIPDDALLVALDVESLYPSIPQSECIDTVYNDMHKHPHLLAMDPNLIARLLHFNINHNYFTFANFIFQQIKGTAMGAAFSPTIANIFMSTILERFLNTQHTQPLLLARYIDDIFMAGTDTTEILNSFLKDLNGFHQNLRFTHQQSQHSIDFLHLMIYKGTQFNTYNILDTKTYQNPLNLYQYLHYTSAHPPKVFKAIVRGECIRYVRTNTSYETYAAMVHAFTQRLHKCGYPNKIIKKNTAAVKYQHRKTYLKHCTRPSQPTRAPPLFKCTPPPQYQQLKRIILTTCNYSHLQFTTPRFVTLSHQTLQKTLIRSKLVLSDSQLVDTTLTLIAATTTTHTETAKLPHLYHTRITITPCRHPRCATCRHHILAIPTFQSTYLRNPTKYHIRHLYLIKLNLPNHM